MKILVIGTGNKNKIAEIVPLLTGLNFDIRSATSYGHFDPVEDGGSLETNAIIKAKAAMEISGEWAISDDTGVFVNALDGEPGIYAARYAGENVPFIENVKKVMKNLEGVPATARGATFATVIALCRPNELPLIFWGSIKGQITEQFKGDGGFGYDPIFLINGVEKTLAELSLEDKNLISHRAIAMNQLRVKLKFLLKGLEQ